VQPSAAELSAGSGLLTAIADTNAMGLDPAVSASLDGQLVQAGQSFVVGDDTDACSTVQLAGDAVSLLETVAGQGGQGGISTAQGDAILADLTPVNRAGCS
jgi:hypothetical protein